MRLLVRVRVCASARSPSCIRPTSVADAFVVLLRLVGVAGLAHVED